MRRSTALIVGLLCIAPGAVAQVARYLAAPPSDILSGRVVLPDPAALDVASTYAVLDLSWRRGADGWSAAIEVPVEREGPLSLGLVGLGAEGWSWTLAAPGDAPRDVEQWAAAGLARRSVEPAGEDDPRRAVGLQLDRA
ncbi:MAG TPA: hypothetical protein VFF36_12780, partial [Planctomycetota bacterium]|nr:hypothetical protein [Planctomycetota bacterium]